MIERQHFCLMFQEKNHELSDLYIYTDLGSLQTLLNSKLGITRIAFKSPATATALQICQKNDFVIMLETSP